MNSPNVCLTFVPGVVHSNLRVVHYQSVQIILNFKRNKHNAELQRTNPSTIVTGEFSTRAVLSHLMPEMDFLLFP